MPTNAEILTSIKQHLNEIDGLQDALQANVAALQSKADSLQPVSDQVDAQTAKLAALNADIAAAPSKLAAVQKDLTDQITASQAQLAQVKAAHAAFVKIATTATE
jgi:chromosome segregation ATPase